MKLREERNEVKTIRVQLICSQDGCDGVMEYGGRVLTSNSPQYPHTCKKCGATINTQKVYPYLEYEED